MNDETKRDIAELMQWQERAYTRLVRLEPKLKQAAEVYATVGLDPDELDVLSRLIGKIRATEGDVVSVVAPAEPAGDRP